MNHDSPSGSFASKLGALRLGVIVCLMFNIFGANRLAQAAIEQRIKSEAENDSWWAERAALFFPRYHFTLSPVGLASFTERNIDLASSITRAPNAPLATRTWDGGGANDNWDTILNWDNNLLPAATDDVVFGTAFTSGTTISLNGNRTVNSFTINTTTGFNIFSNTLTLTSGTLTRNDVAGTEANHIIASDITLGANGVWTINGSGTLTVSGAIGDGANTFGLTKEGTGTLVFSAFMTYGGNTTINAGTLQIGTLAFTGNVQVNSGGTLGVGAAGAVVNGLSGAGSIDHNVGGTHTFQVGNNGANGNFSGIISNSAGNLLLQKTGTGTQILSGANTYTESTEVFAGVLNIQNNTALGTIAGDARVLSSGAALELQGGIAVGAKALSLNGTGISNGGALRNVSGNNSWGGTITLADLAGGHRINSDAGTLTIGGGITETGNTDGKNLTFGGAGNITVNGVISATNAADMLVTKDGSGVLTFTGANTYAGTTTVNAGTLLVNNSTGAGAVTVNNSGTVLGGTGTISGAVTVNANAKVQGGNGTTGTTLTLAGGLTLADNSIIQLALGPGLTHSTLARTGSGTWTFDSNQAFNFIDLGATSGTYQNIITNIANPPSEGSWTITNAAWTGTFIYDGANIDLNLTAVPEPGTWIGAALAVGVVGWSLLKKRKTETRKS